MDYYPSKSEMNLMQLFAHRKITLNRLNNLGLSCPYISDQFTYDQLYLQKVEQDFNLNEVAFLKEGIVCIFNCLTAIEKEKDLSEKEFENQIRIKEKDRIESFRKLDGFSEEYEKDWVAKNVKRKLEENERSKSITLSTLKKDLVQFKINLARYNIDVSINKEKIDFLNPGQELKTPADTITENPHPEIFINLDAYIIFRKLHFIFKDNKHKLADYSFIYRKMILDGLIHDSCKPEIFRKWINAEPYLAEAEPALKTYDNCTTDIKLNIYNLIAKGVY